MDSYQPPLRDMRFVLQELHDAGSIRALPGHEELDRELEDTILEEAGRFAAEVLAPLNRSGDRDGVRVHGETVSTPAGFRDAYQQFVEAGWNGLGCPAEHGGQALPEVLASAAQEMWQSANMAFALCPLLTAGAIETLAAHGTAEQKARYLDRLVSGEWTGTMNLTEPQAGSDLAAVRCRAVPDGDAYRIHGQKIYITWGEHDCAGNIVHLVLARLPDAPPGVRGISLFIVPRNIPDADGQPGERNDVRCLGSEHKLGIHASPTCTMAFGEGDGALAELVGQPGEGLALMFTMMNAARHKVGIQGLAIAERAWQQARGYALERVQGRPAGATDDQRRAIAHHPDVRRMLLSMRSRIEAMRALCYTAAWSMDMAHAHPDEHRRATERARAEFLVPIVKGWCTETGQEITSLGIQVHGGMGYVEETGAAQHFRDARITTIYEGTTAIQANDLVGRKTHRDGGRTLFTLLAELEGCAAEAQRSADPGIRAQAAPLEDGIAALREAGRYVIATHADRPAATAAGAVPYLMLAGTVLGGGLLVRSALVARAALDNGSSETAFYEGKIVTGRFYCQHVLPQASAWLPAVLAGEDAVGAMPPEWL